MIKRRRYKFKTTINCFYVLITKMINFNKYFIKFFAQVLVVKFLNYENQQAVHPFLKLLIV